MNRKAVEVPAEIYDQLSDHHYDGFFRDDDALRNGRNLEKKNDLWRYLKQEDAADYFRIRHGIFGTVMSSKSKPGQKIAVYAYKVAQKLYGFN